MILKKCYHFSLFFFLFSTFAAPAQLVTYQIVPHPHNWLHPGCNYDHQKLSKGPKIRGGDDWHFAPSIFQVQKDDNYITFTVNAVSSTLVVTLKEKEKDEKQISSTEIGYAGSIVLKIRSADHTYSFEAGWWWTYIIGCHFQRCATKVCCGW